MIDQLVEFDATFKRLGLERQSYNFKALTFLLNYNGEIKYITEFIENFKIILDDFENCLKIKFNQLNIENWIEIEKLRFTESEYYFFLRLKVFIFDLQNRDDHDESIEWLEFFQEKFIECHKKSS